MTTMIERMCPTIEAELHVREMVSASPQVIARLLANRIARAALTALLAPTEAMTEAGGDNLFGSAHDDWSVDAREVFVASIQAALDEKEGV